MATLHFRDSGLRNGSKLKMVPPQRERETERAGASEEQEAAVDEEAEEGMLVAGEGGEDEMLEIEGGEDEMQEER